MEVTAQVRAGSGAEWSNVYASMGATGHNSFRMQTTDAVFKHSRYRKWI